MWKGIRELVDLLLLWGFWYLGSFMLMIVAIFYFIQSNQPIIQEQHYHTTKQVFQTPTRVLVEREVCIDPRGCEILKGGECPTCVIEDVWE